MDSVQVLHVSDTHLGYRQYGLYEREIDIYRVWGEIVDEAVRERVDLVIHSGDFFDTSKPPPQAIREAIRGLRVLRDKGIPFVAVMGDHDVPKRRQLPPNALLDELGLASTLGLRGGYEARRLRTRGGAEVYVAGVTSQRGPGARQRLLDYLARLPAAERVPSVLLLHQTLQEAAPDYELGLGELPKGYSYYALGHIHVHRGWRLGDAYAAYPGSPEALRLDEARQQQDRYVLLAELRPGATVSLQQLRLETPRPQLVEEIVYRDMEALRGHLLGLRERLARYPPERRPILHLAIRSVPRGKKLQIYKLVEQLMRPVTLAYRLNIETFEEELPRQLQSTGQLRLEDLLRELLRDQQLVELAQKLIGVAGSGGTKAALVEEITRLIKTTYGIED